MALYVVRHGRTEANASRLLLGRADPRLDSVGRQQARDIADALPEATVVSSPLRRCVETAVAVTSGDQDAVRTDERLLELDYGRLDLMPLSEVPVRVWDDWRADVHYRPAGGETLVELADRVGAALGDLWAEAAERDVVAVTHVSPIKAALAWALGVSIEISWRSFVGQASITKIGAGPDGRPSLQLFNDTGHLGRVGRVGL